MIHFLIVFLLLIESSYTFSDVGMWDISMSGEKCDLALTKSLFKESRINVRLHCNMADSMNISVAYTWTADRCSHDYLHYFEKRNAECVSAPKRTDRSIANQTLSHYFQVEKLYVCQAKKIISFEDHMDTESQTNIQAQTSQKVKPLLVVDKDGIYKFQMNVKSLKDFNLTVHIEMISPYGYLSAAIWPLLPFFGVMCGVYTLLCTGWLLVCWLQWRDLLRIQYWIGAVALLGMIESATFYAVFSSINNTGYFNPHAYIFAVWVSVTKRALARMLVIIVSLGFGIVKPRLGPALQRVLGVGILWGILAAIDAWLRLHHKQNDSNRDFLLSEAPLSLLDSAICWWVFVSLAHTMRTLQLRRNAVKLSLYRHFTNTLIFAVISSVVFILYSLKNFRVNDCIMDWKQVWIDEAYWHILFASVLTVIMILWRPTNNNQRYAFTPLLDNAEDDDEEEEQFVNDAYGVKMRGSNINSGDNLSQTEAGGSNAHLEPTSNSLDNDLRWVEENIPTSALPLLDSDEEIINTKFEVSKMQ